MDQVRRNFLKSMGAVMAVCAAGLLKSGSVFAATWNTQAFTSKDSADAMKLAGYVGAVREQGYRDQGARYRRERCSGAG